MRPNLSSVPLQQAEAGQPARNRLSKALGNSSFAAYVAAPIASQRRPRSIKFCIS
jgi:hypothetical protein